MDLTCETNESGLFGNDVAVRLPHQVPREGDGRPSSFVSPLDAESRDNCRKQFRQFEGIVGSSPALRDALELALTVAPIHSTVLIQGATGSGKELIAQAIHRHSRRNAGPFVKLNCAAIPLGLVESELFGHERGAFTGAVGRKIGRFETANRGSLFLDEIGDIPLELPNCCG